jgi:predicted protein tyrosine phosphatase
VIPVQENTNERSQTVKPAKVKQKKIILLLFACMIVDARAVMYDQMVNFVQNGNISFHADVSKPENSLQKHDLIKIISVTDIGMPRIFEKNTDNICSLVFNDVEPGKIDFIANTEQIEFMTPEQAKQVVDFIEKIHELPEKVLLLVNCKFGMCRSGAIVDYASLRAGLGFWATKRRNPQIVPNHWVQYLLMQEFFKRKFNNGAQIS